MQQAVISNDTTSFTSEMTNVEATYVVENKLPSVTVIDIDHEGMAAYLTLPEKDQSNTNPEANVRRSSKSTTKAHTGANQCAPRRTKTAKSSPELQQKCQPSTIKWRCGLY